nr:MAG TPA: tail protein [Caudoviricetes sp.]
MITFVDEKGTEHSALVAYSVTNAVNGELSVKGTIYTNDKVLHGIGRGWRFRLDDEYFRITYAKPNDTGRQIEVEFDAVHQFFYDMSKSMVYTTLNGSKPFETYLQAIFSDSGYTYSLETTVGSIRKENFGNKSRLSLFNDIIKAAGLEFSVRGHVVRILKRIGTDLSAIVRKDFNMNELKIEKNINSFVTYQRGLGAWKDDEDHSKGRYESEYESPLAKIYGRIEADPVVDERYKETGKLLERLKENVDKSYKVSVEIDMEDLSRAGYRLSLPNSGDYIMAINETLGFRQKVRIVSFTSEYDVGGNLISRKVVCNDIGTVQRATSEISHLSRTLTDSIEGSERALKTATRALVSADGKNTNYFGDVKPLDVPKGTLRKGDRLFLTVGDKKQLYFWNGAEWELEPTEFDHEKFDMEFNRKSQEIKKTIQENRQKAIEALQNAGASTLLAQEAKRISEQARADITNLQASSQNALNQIESFKTQYGTKLNEVKSTADGLLTKMGAVEIYISKDGQRQEALRRYTQEESAKQATAVRELVTRDYVGKATYQEDVRDIERRLEAITNSQNGSIATQIAKYKTAVDGRFADITSMLSGKANQTDFQRVRETSQLYERIIGSSESDIAEKVSRMALTNKLFQVEVAKNVGDGRNYVKNADFREGSKNWKETNISGLNFNYEHSLKNRGKTGIHIYGSAGTTEFYGIRQTFKFEGSKNDNVILSFLASKDGANDFSGIRIGVHCRKNNAIISQMWRTIQNSEITGFSYKKIILMFNLPVDIDEVTLMVYGELKKTINIYISEIKFEKGSNATPFTLAPEDTDEAIRSVQSQLAGSWAVQNLTSAGSIVSQINATNNQILIEAEKIRLKGKTLLDELTAIQGYFKRLFVGEGAFAKLNAEIIASKTITADKLVMDMAMARMFVSSDIFTDTLAAKEAFINKLRSVVVTATLLEGFKGWIGGFQIGTHEKDSSVYWITGQNQFSVGMSNGSGHWSQTALWVNWGNKWESPSDYAWFVKHTGQMYCYNRAEFWNTPIIHGDLKVTGHIFYNNENSGKSGYWIHSSKYSNFEPSNNYLYLYYSGSGYDWIPMNKEISDCRYKSNIEASTVSGLDVVESLKTYRYRKEYDGKIEDIACGIMAQDVQKFAPEAFFENPDGAYSYNTFALVPYLIKAIQELNQKIEKLEKTA